MSAVELEDALPAVDGGLGPVRRALDAEEGMAGVVVAMELVVLAGRLERPFELVDLLAAGELVLVAEQAEQRAIELRRAVDQRP